MSIIGKMYKPSDNSYAVCLSDAHQSTSKQHYLSGTYYPGGEIRTPRQEVKILSEPFKIKILLDPCFNTKERTYTFILVECKRGLTHSVLFNERNIIKE